MSSYIDRVDSCYKPNIVYQLFLGFRSSGPELSTRSYLAADNGADLIVGRRGRTGDVGVAVAEAAGTVEVEASWADS